MSDEENEFTDSEPPKSAENQPEVIGDNKQKSESKVKSDTQKRKKRGDDRREEDEGPKIELPPCGHAWCLGEVLRKAGLENGVCCPRALPWGRPGRLKYLPGWQELCMAYGCQEARYEKRRQRKKKDEDVARWEDEVKEAKRVWSFLGPVLSFPGKVTYEEPKRRDMCECPVSCCEYRPPPTQNTLPPTQNTLPPTQNTPPPTQSTDPPPNTTTA